MIKKEIGRFKKDLITEIQCMWNVKVIPVNIRGNEAISKSLRQHMSNIPGKHEIKELQKTYWTLHTYCGKC